MKRAVQENGFHSPVAKKSKIKMEKKDKEEEERETFLCRFCGNEIARDDDLLSRLELHTSFGFFRARFYSSLFYIVNFASHPGFGKEYEHVYCSDCGAVLGAILVLVLPQEYHSYGEHWESGNHLMIMNNLRIRRGNVLLDAVTREEVN